MMETREVGVMGRSGHKARRQAALEAERGKYQVLPRTFQKECTAANTLIWPCETHFGFLASRTVNLHHFKTLSL